EQQAEVVVVEVGGTVGDIESLPYLEAIRQFRNDVGRQNVLYIHLTLPPRVATGELKTKPTQHSVRELRASGIPPDVLIARAAVPLTIGLVGKYIELPDAYLSVAEAVRHAAWAAGCDVRLEWIDSERLERSDDVEPLVGLDGLVVPGGFGYRGIEGKVKATRFGRERRLPTLGLCMGMQCMVIELARTALGTEDATS